MAEPRQRPIPVTSQERAALEQQKRRYEQFSGDRGDWGKFLSAVTLLGLAALGIYHLARGTRRSDQAVNVECCVCRESFLMAIPNEVGRAVYVLCPHCNAELVVDLGMPR